jgi:predicted CopG family antitoxin
VTLVRRTQLQLDDDIYELLRQEAFNEGVSISELVRRIIRRHIEAGDRIAQAESLSFVSIGESVQGDLAPVSERHDEALWDAP